MSYTVTYKEPNERGEMVHKRHNFKNATEAAKFCERLDAGGGEVSRILKTVALTRGRLAKDAEAER